MAKWNDLPWREDVYKAAEQWRDKCFFNDGSIFDYGNIWTRENFLTLKERILDDPDTSDQNFYEKLELQLYRAPRDSVLLMAEIMWFIYLFPIGRQPVPDSPNKRIRLSTKWETKRNKIAEILSWVGEALLETDVTSPQALSGLGRTGRIYKQYFSALRYILPVLLDWKQLPLSKLLAYKDTSRCWDLAKLLNKEIGKQSPPWRHALLFFLYPDEFERMVSSDHKIMLVEHFGPQLNMGTSQFTGSSMLQTDKAIYEIRNRLKPLFPNEMIDFYLEPIQVNGHWIDLAVADEMGTSTGNSDTSASQMCSRSISGEEKSSPILSQIPLSLEEIEEKKPAQRTEGKRRLQTHYRRERSPTLRKCKIERMIKEHGALICECCGTKAETYQKLRRQRIFEVHHKKPLSDGLTINGIDDLALLCANCHRGIHASDPLMSVEDFKAECGFE